jgi:lycopene beta-cyclase
MMNSSLSEGNMDKVYDYIIAGGGLAGLSLVYYIISEPSLKSKKILVIDSVVKDKNDRTWCFWEKEKEFYEPLVQARWKKLKFESPTLSKVFHLEEYEYKLIRSDDYYRFILEKARMNNVEFKTETITSITDVNGLVLVNTHLDNYTASYVFNSTNLFRPAMSEEDTLLQHFLGWFIKTDSNRFDSSVGTLMDFTLPQDKGIAFMYVLPTHHNEALVEYTLFNEKTLTEAEYAQQLKQYIRDKLDIKHYEVTHQESGIIPMSKAKFNTAATGESNIINIGTSGGYTKPSTGYTFKFVHKKVKAITEKLAGNEKPLLKQTFREKMFRWYDLTLLDVLLEKKSSGEKIFTSLFEKNNPERILAFLLDESTHLDEFRIGNSVPLIPFLSSGIKQLLS